jgi:hypothetical protein
MPDKLPGVTLTDVHQEEYDSLVTSSQKERRRKENSCADDKLSRSSIGRYMRMGDRFPQTMVVNCEAMLSLTLVFDQVISLSFVLMSYSCARPEKVKTRKWF